LPAADGTFDVVFVCTANRYRSPIAAALFNAAAREAPARARSVGTLAVEGEAPVNDAVELARRRGLEISSHRALPATADALASADLVIGFEYNHVATAVIDAGADRSHTFLLPELVELLEDVEPPRSADPVGRAREAVEAASDVRRERGPAMPREIADPIGRPLKEGEQIIDQVAGLTIRLVHLLFPT
jgi:protein-tyrosine phosphatase